MDVSLTGPGKDALSPLIEALLEGRHPPETWIARWSTDGADPVQAAWDQSDSSTWMLQLLCHRWPSFERQARAAVAATVDARGRLHRFVSRLTVQEPFSPDLTRYGPHLPISLAHALSDYARGRPGRTKKLADAIRAAVPEPPSLDALTTRYAGAYALGEKIVVHAETGHGGAYVVVPPVLPAERSEADSGLGRKVREVLAAFTSEHPRARIAKGERPIAPVLKAIGARSYRRLQEEGRASRIEDTARGLILLPTHNGGNRGDQRGFHFLRDQAVRLDRDASEAAIGAALREAFARCT